MKKAYFREGKRASGWRLDTVLWLLAVLVALILRFDFDIYKISPEAALVLGLSLAVLMAAFGTLNHLYRKRYVRGSLDEISALLTATLLTAAVGSAAGLVAAPLLGLPRSAVLISSAVFLILAAGWRISGRLVRKFSKDRVAGLKRALVFGAGAAGEALVHQLQADTSPGYRVVALLDDDPEKSNLSVRGVRVAGRLADLDRVAAEHRASVVIVAIPTASAALLAEVHHLAIAGRMSVLVLPTLSRYLAGENSPDQLRQVSVEDLISRQSTILDVTKVRGIIKNKRVVVTGAGGSIGSELARQISHYEPLELMLVDRDETGLLMAQMSIDSYSESTGVNTWLLDIRDAEQVHKLFDSVKPDIVFHAAALKHVTFLERFPNEAHKTNIVGTINVVSAALQANVGRFVNISTDKAADPQNVLGRSKAIAEQVTSWAGGEVGRPFVSVRFGNVLGSRGSLVPILADQIARGGPVRLTHPDAKRFFMSTYEACELLLQAVADGEEGDVLVLDMGDPVSIRAVAERMILISNQQIEIEYTGLRPGETMTEQLFSGSENPQPTSHDRVSRIKSPRLAPSQAEAVVL